MLARSNHGYGDALIPAKLAATVRENMDLALRRLIERGHPARKVANGQSCAAQAEQPTVQAPGPLPVTDVASLPPQHPVAETEADEALGFLQSSLWQSRTRTTT